MPVRLSLLPSEPRVLLPLYLFSLLRDNISTQVIPLKSSTDLVVRFLTVDFRNYILDELALRLASITMTHSQATILLNPIFWLPSLASTNSTYTLMRRWLF